MEEFNTDKPVGGIYVASFKKNTGQDLVKNPIVAITAYCLNKNHFHLILKPLIERGGSLFMQRLCAGYTKYYNEKYERSGALFQGKYKRVLVETNEQLLHLSAYVSVNDRAHPGLNPPWFKHTSFSSFAEYLGESSEHICTDKNIILEQYISTQEFSVFVESSLIDILERKQHEKQLKSLCID